MLVTDFIDAAAQRHPYRVAVVFEDQALTYSDLRRRSNELAFALRTLGDVGARVGVLCDNRPEYAESYYAVPGAGMVLTPINQRCGISEIGHVVASAGISILITEKRYLPVALSVAAEESSLEHILCVDGTPEQSSGPYTLHPYEQLMHRVRSSPAGWPVPSGRDEDPAWLVHTSGTTGKAKGVVLSHRNLTGVVANHLLGVPVRSESGYLMPFPLCHVGGHVVFACAAVGATLILQRSFDAAEFFDLVRAYNIETSPLAPTMLAMLLADEYVDVSTPSLRTLVYGSSGISEGLLRAVVGRFPDVGFIQGYGMTETAGTVTWLSSEDHREALTTGEANALRSCGRPAPLVDVQVFDECGATLPPNELGEVRVRGDQVMLRYWDDSSATDEALRDGWLRTGDIGYFDVCGRLYIVDRAKDLVISGGENISSLEVERVLEEHPNIREAAVVGATDPIWGQRVVAYVVAAMEPQPREADIIEHCKSRLASFKKPAQVYFVAALPRNRLGKVLKARLRADAEGQDVH